MTPTAIASCGSREATPAAAEAGNIRVDTRTGAAANHICDGRSLPCWRSLGRIEEPTRATMWGGRWLARAWEEAENECRSRLWMNERRKRRRRERGTDRGSRRGLVGSETFSRARDAGGQKGRTLG